MNRRLKLVLIVIFVPIIVSVAAYRIAESPNRMLKYSLHISSIPPSIRNLQMNSEVWTDEVRDFQFDIDPIDFPRLLLGREYRSIDFAPFDGKTITPFPIATSKKFRWENKIADCTITTNEQRTHVHVFYTRN